jgi:general secretion pathway protein A
MSNLRTIRYPANTMHASYFGLKEASFSITPDPQYLFLSQRHREALAHLLYGASESGGFVLLTGEVGTGKTTLCRAFLEQLPEQVDIALILNPAVSARELMQSICDEFGIQTATPTASVKTLVDQLNTYLLAAHAQGRRPVLMIDEAQTLRPKVLEHIRLLTNLETAKHKLLQIFLIGQPELRDLLDKPRLRQLAQRITARYHLMPLDRQETAAYIHHRLQVAGAQQPLFNAAALRQIHQISGGIPRLINILCEHSLLGAYATHRRQVDRRIVRGAAREVFGEYTAPPRLKRHGAPLLAVTLAMTLIAGLSLWWLPTQWPADTWRQWRQRLGMEQAAVAQPSPDTQTAAVALALPALPTETAATTPMLDGFADKNSALALLLKHWGIEMSANSGGLPCEQASARGLACRSGSATDFAVLRRHDRPALIELRQSEAGSLRYLVLSVLGATQATLEDASGRIEISLQELQSIWSGEFTILWKTATGGHTLIGSQADKQALAWLGERLRQSGDLPSTSDASTADYATLRPAIERFQSRQGLNADGIAGPETLIQLNNALNLPGIPHLHGDG